MIAAAAVDYFTPAQLFEHLGVSIDLAAGDDRTVLVVRFASGDCEHWVPAPDGYPLDGSRDFIHFGGRYFVPVAEVV